MTMLLELSEEQQLQLQARAAEKGLTPEGLIQTLLSRELTSAAGPRPPRSSLYGLLKDHGPAPTSEEIDENRRDMLKNSVFDPEFDVSKYDI